MLLRGNSSSKLDSELPLMQSIRVRKQREENMCICRLIILFFQTLYLGAVPQTPTASSSSSAAAIVSGSPPPSSKTEPSTEPMLFSKYSLEEIADAVTFVMFRVFKSLGPAELHDGAWQVNIHSLPFTLFLSLDTSLTKLRNIFLLGKRPVYQSPTFTCSESFVQQNRILVHCWGLLVSW